MFYSCLYMKTPENTVAPLETGWKIRWGLREPLCFSEEVERLNVYADCSFPPGAAHGASGSFILFLKTCLLINYSQPWCIWTRTCVSKCPRDRERAHTMYFFGSSLALKRGQSRRGGGRRWRGPEMRWHFSWTAEMWQYRPWKTKCCDVVASALHSGLKCVRKKKRT